MAVYVLAVGAGSASRMLLYLSCSDLKPSDIDASLRELSIDRRHVNLDQLLIEGRPSSSISIIIIIQNLRSRFGIEHHPYY